MIHISFIVPYESMKLTVEQIFREHPEREVIRQSILAKTVEEIEEKDLAS